MNRGDQLTNIKISYNPANPELATKDGREAVSGSSNIRPARKQANNPVLEAVIDDDDESPRSHGADPTSLNRGHLPHTYDP